MPSRCHSKIGTYCSTLGHIGRYWSILEHGWSYFRDDLIAKIRGEARLPQATWQEAKLPRMHASFAARGHLQDPFVDPFHGKSCTTLRYFGAKAMMSCKLSLKPSLGICLWIGYWRWPNSIILVYLSILVDLVGFHLGILRSMSSESASRHTPSSNVWVWLQTIKKSQLP